MSSPPSSQPELGELSPEPGDPGDVDADQTGHHDVDRALHRLTELDSLPVADHTEVYDDVQRRLAAAMDDMRDRQPPTRPG